MEEDDQIGLDIDAESELFEHLRIIVDKGQALLRIDKFLKEKIVNSSRNKIQTAADAGNILVNEKPVKSVKIVNAGEYKLPKSPKEGTA